ncbi:hypothetical protein YC2023_061252 [Brassica napus]
MGEDSVRRLPGSLPESRLEGVAVISQSFWVTFAFDSSLGILLQSKSSFESYLSGSCGTVIRNAEMKVVDTITGVSLPHNKPGEICIRGDQLMKGKTKFNDSCYLNDPQATAQTIDKDGWLHTGDIGFVDDDDEIFIVDRLKELIKFKGYQVAPAELEALLISHPFIEDVAVVA